MNKRTDLVVWFLGSELSYQGDYDSQADPDQKSYTYFL